MAGLTVSLFEDVVAKVAVLAAFMPIIACQSGNTGVQTLTMITRELALSGIRVTEAGRALFKAVSMGLINGTAIGAITGLLAFIWRGDGVLASVVAVWYGALARWVFLRQALSPAEDKPPPYNPVSPHHGLCVAYS